MIHTCSKCSFEAQPGARFCRQCGAALFVEREETLAATRQQSSSTLRSGQWSQQSSPDTTHFVRTSPQAATPVYNVPQPKANSSLFWALVGGVCAIATAGLLSASLLSMRVDHSRGSSRDAITTEIADEIRREAKRRAQEIARVSEEKGRAAAEMARAAEELARAKEKLITPGSPPSRPKSGLLLEPLIYPGAVVSTRVSTGNEAMVIKLETADDLAKVREFYTERLGEPQSASRSRLVFVKSESGVNLVVKIGPKPAARGKLEIALARTAPPRSGNVVR